MGVGVYQALASSRFRNTVNGGFVGETGAEIYYHIQITPWFTLTPDFQFIDSPGGLRTTEDSFFFGLRTRVTF